MGMNKLPYYRFWDSTPLVVNIKQGIDDDGVPVTVDTYTGKCRYSERVKNVRSSDGSYIRLQGALTIRGDIAPDVDAIEGDVEVNGLTRKIFRSFRPRNPDGTVHHTKLELI
jgi:hypothetical protein